MYHPALSRIQRLHAAMDAREINTLAACREIAGLAKELQETDPDAFARYETLTEERRTRQYRDFEQHPANNGPDLLKPADKAAKSAIKPLRNLYSDAAERRRTSANARRWCIESGIWTIRDLTDTQSRVLVELLRECLKAKRQATYLTHDQLAERAGCSRSSVKTTMRLLIERSLIYVRRERIAARKNAPNLYLPCSHLVRSLGPFVSSKMSIGGQDTAPLGLRDNISLNPTENPTPSQKAKNGRKINVKDQKCRNSVPRPSFNTKDRETAVQAIPILDGTPISTRTADDELHTRIDKIRSILLPELSSWQYDRALRERGTGAAIALLATALKAMTRTTDPIRSPAAYFIGTVDRKRPKFNPIESLRSTIQSHMNCQERINISNIFHERVIARESCL